MHTLLLVRLQRAVDHESIRVISRVDIIIILREACGVRRCGTGSVLVHAEVLPLVRVGTHALREGVPRVPVDGEVDARVVGHRGVGDGVLAQPAVLVDADGVALFAVGGLTAQVLGVGTTEDVETVAVVGSDDDEG